MIGEFGLPPPFGGGENGLPPSGVENLVYPPPRRWLPPSRVENLVYHPPSALENLVYPIPRPTPAAIHVHGLFRMGGGNARTTPRFASNARGA